ncbi:response regulator [Spirosoma sp. BT702]|uniref:Response regulator n=1 Tax=Spirosoma profusum TaxID=2771354 RepID=A0A926XYD6_9BACT|nr:response regulator [Spirosoma profusum]MBD2703219.1 response regulator [Spirosoma profusum]
MKTYNVLIVDDDEDDQYLIRTAFERASNHYNLQFATDGTDVLEGIESPQFLPDLVLLDLNMPIISGFEVLKHLKTSPLYRHVPVVVLTTSDNENDINRAYELGANTYIVKPINHRALVDLAEQIRLYWFGVAKTPTRRTN